MCLGGMAGGGGVERGGGLSLPAGAVFGNKWENDTLLLYKHQKLLSLQHEYSNEFLR